MKLYDFGPAANAQRVRVYLAETGIDVPIQELNVREDHQFAEPYTSMNPFHCVPFLELDDGAVIAESITICRYLDETRADAPLLGTTPEERAEVDMWLRRAELDGFIPLLHAVRNHVPMFAGRVVPGTRTDLPQLPKIVRRGKEMAAIFFDRMERHMQGRDWVALDRLTIADISGYFTYRMTRPLEMDTAAWPNIERWFGAIAARPAFQL